MHSFSSITCLLLQGMHDILDGCMPFERYDPELCINNSLILDTVGTGMFLMAHTLTIKGSQQTSRCPSRCISSSINLHKALQTPRRVSDSLPTVGKDIPNLFVCSQSILNESIFKFILQSYHTWYESSHPPPLPPSC